jgi:DNA-binding CsgD family transcriptional regulator
MLAGSIRHRTGETRFAVHQADYEASVAALRGAMGEQDFESAWNEGAALSTEEAIAYAQRGRGERKRPSSGWASLTPTERDVVRLVREGLSNKDIGTRLFISPHTVQTHLSLELSADIPAYHFPPFKADGTENNWDAAKERPFDLTKNAASVRVADYETVCAAKTHAITTRPTD